MSEKSPSAKLKDLALGPEKDLANNENLRLIADTLKSHEDRLQALEIKIWQRPTFIYIILPICVAVLTGFIMAYANQWLFSN